jgi:hypothetical protein
MSLWMEHLNELEHYHALLREAEQERIAREVLQGRQENHTVYGSVMSWLGSHLCAWGDQLQERYGNATATSIPGGIQTQN